MKILVVGGAGYIGSHMVKTLHQANHEVVVVDDLSTGYRDSVQNAELVIGSIADRRLLADLFSRHRFNAVMHFASSIRIDESIANPEKYYRNNLTSTLTLLEAMRKSGVLRFIFSSSASVYGNPKYCPINEDHPKAPLTPYGRSKWMVEQILEDYDRAYGLKSIKLRYFNAAGADPDGQLGERHDPETHLIPLVLQVASGRRRSLTVFGRDYDTPDGTCIRDYIHVTDLVEANALALDYLMNSGESGTFNLGNSNGFSVQEIINTARTVTGREISLQEAPRREGEPPRLVADASLANKVFGWQPRYGDLETIIAHAWQWEKKYFGN
jgi:UDP-glucose 4-epimerase